MKILFVHPNMPGQYKHLCREMAKDPKNTVVFITKPKNFEIENVHKVEFKVNRDPNPSTHHYLTNAERAVIHGQEVWRMCKKLKEEEGFEPDIVCAHPGWGSTLYVKDIFPNAPLLSFFEFYYHARGVDVNFDPEFPGKVDDYGRVRTKNIVNLLNLECADWGLAPTFWQHSLHPKDFHHKISVIHDGIDVDYCQPDPKAEFTTPNGTVFKFGDEVVTYIARNFEPYRGFHKFMKAAEIIQKERPNCHIIAVGADDVSYGRKLPKGESWRQKYLEEVTLDHDRIHFTGTVPYAQLIKLFQVSAAHIYLTYPFVLSWSTLEAMACGVALVGSNTSPVEEVVKHEENGLIADFFSPEDIVSKVFTILDDKDQMRGMREKARQTVVENYALKTLLPLHVGLVKDLAKGKNPPPTHEKIMNMYTNR